MTSNVQDYYHRILPYYDAELSDRGDEDFWLRMTPPGCRVLELGAGTGRATRLLAQKAGCVVASELSPELIAEARRKLRGLPNVHLLAADMRELHLQERFDLIAAVDDPFVHLIEDEGRDRAFRGVAEHLAPSGRFVLDAAWFPPEDRESRVQERTALNGRLHIREVWSCDPGTRLCTARFEYRQDGEPAAEASFPGRLWSIEELEDRARAAGLRVSSLWGDYDGRAWDRASSPRLIAELTPGCIQHQAARSRRRLLDMSRVRGM